MHMKVLAIDTSCDDTCASVVEGTRIISNVISSQISLFEDWGGVVPNLAKRAHEERIETVIAKAITGKFSIFNFPRCASQSGLHLVSQFSNHNQFFNEKMKTIDVIGVTQGPGLSPALGVGINKAKELAKTYGKKLVAVNHIEGHLLSPLLTNSQGKPDRQIEFPILALTVSGGHTKIVRILNLSKDKYHPDFKFEVVGETLDDAGGEALDKASKMLGLGYPGGPIIEKLAKSGDPLFMKLPVPMKGSPDLNMSFSGLKTAFYYAIRDWEQARIIENLENLASSFQKAVFDSLIFKFNKAIDKYQPKSLFGVGGVINNITLRKELRKLAKNKGLPIYFPFRKDLNGDNASMIGVVAYYKALRGEFVKDIDKLDREPRLEV